MTLNSSPVALQPARSGDTVERTADILKARILDGGLAPGQRLISRDLMEELGVSRGSLREAFQRLAADRLIDLIPNRGAIVRRLTADEVIHLFQIREALEGQAARLAAERLDENQRPAFTALVEEGHRHRGGADLPAFIEYNRRFHQAIVTISGNRELAELIDRYQLTVFMYMLRHSVGPARLIRDSVDQHDAIAQAILGGDGSGAYAAMKVHLWHTAEGILEKLGQPGAGVKGHFSGAATSNH